MAITITQTDSTTGACTGASENRIASEGGTAGSTEMSVSLPQGTGQLPFQFTYIVPAGVSGDAGNWTVRYNVTTENMFCTCTGVTVTRANSSCVTQETLGTTNPNEDLSTPGVKTASVSCSSASLTAGDKIVILLNVDQSNMNSQTLGVTPDQDINTSFTNPSALSGPNWQGAGWW